MTLRLARSCRTRSPRAREAGLAELVIESDPDAEPFYRAHGAEPAGTRSSWSTGRELPLLRIATG